MDFESFKSFLLAWGVPSSLLNYSGWIYKVFFVVLLTLTLNLVIRLLLDKLYAWCQTTKTPWDDLFVKCIYKPCRILVWFIGILWAAEIAHNASGAAIFEFLDPLRKVGVVVIFTWFLVRVIRIFEDALQNPEKVAKPLDATTAGAVGKLLRASVIITSTLVIMQNLGYSISGVLAFGGFGGIAVGFAAKDLLANFFGGLVIYVDRPFVVGEWIRSPDQEIEGTVEHIGWRITRIRTFDQRPLYVPNGTFVKISIENPSRMHNRRINETVGVRYCDINSVAPMVQDIKNMLIEHEEIDNGRTLIVNFNQFGASSLDILLYTFTKTTNWVKFHQVKEDVLLKVSEIVANHQAEIAFPTRTLMIDSVPSAVTENRAVT